jgi:hypothetical protein
MASAACCCDHRRAARNLAKFAARLRRTFSKGGTEAMPTRSPCVLPQKPHIWGVSGQDESTACGGRTSGRYYLAKIGGGTLSELETGATKQVPTKKCPFCAEGINEDAIRCRFCGGIILQSPVFDMRGFLLILEPAVALALLGICYFHVHVLTLPFYVAAVITSLTVVAATTIAWDEADLATSAPPGKVQRPRPFAWFLFVLCMWAIAYPAHMFRRRTRLVPGVQAVASPGVALLLTLTLVAGTLGLLHLTHLKLEEIRLGQERAAEAQREAQRAMAVRMEKIENPPLTLEVTWASSVQRINTRIGDYYTASEGHHYLSLTAKVKLAEDAVAPVFITADSFRLVAPSGKELREETESDMSLWKPFLHRAIAPGKWDNGTLLFIDDSSLSGIYELQWNGARVSAKFNPVEIDVGNLKASNQKNRKWATEQLLQIGPEALPELLRAQRKTFSEDEDVQAGVANLVKRLASRSIPQLVAALQDKEIAGQAAFALSQIGKPAAGAVPALTELAKASDTRLRSLAILALSKMGVAARPAFEILTAALGDPDDLTRRYAAEALKGIGADGRAAVAAAGKNGEKP